jgi:pyruvate ferredoxin oxidoreductase gamma subunit
VLVLDPGILRLVNVAGGLKDDGMLVANTRYAAEDLKKELDIRQALATVNATQIALEELGLPITNTTMLGALLKAREVVRHEALIDPLKNRFGRIAEKNIRAYERAFAETKTIQ